MAPRDLPPPEAPLSDQEANKLPDPGTEGAEAALLGSHGSNPALHHLGLDPDEKLDYSHSHTLEDGEGHDSPRPYEDGADHGAAPDAEVDGQAGEHDGHAPAEEYPGLVYLCSSADPDCDDTMSVVSGRWRRGDVLVGKGAMVHGYAVALPNTTSPSHTPFVRSKMENFLIPCFLLPAQQCRCHDRGGAG